MRVRLARIAVMVQIGIGVPLLLQNAPSWAWPRFDVFNAGIAEALGGSFGTWYIVNSLAFYAVGALLGARRRAGEASSAPSPWARSSTCS